MSDEGPSTSLRVKSIEEMRVLAERVAQEIKPGDVLLLEGELGSGKTTFVQGLAGALGVKEQVTSPTFAIVSEYETGKSARIKRLIHVDLYRLSDDEAAAEPAVREILAQSSEGERVTVVEWADKLGESVPAKARRIEFAHGATEGERVVTL